MTNVAKGEKGFVSQTVPERFWSKVDKRGPDECWPWLGGTCNGYGTIWVGGGRSARAPQVAWSLHHHQDFPAGFEACHRCDNPGCVNPTHIWPGTHRENMLDAWDKGILKPVSDRRKWLGEKTHCKRGHPLSGDNLRRQPLGRACRACDLIHAAKGRAKRRLARSTLTSDPTL